MRRGQLFSYDLLLASAALMFILALFLLTDRAMLDRMDETDLRAGLQEASQTATDSLLWTPGNPSNWEQSQITESGTRSLGLANSPGELDPEKVAAFFSIGNTSAEYNASLQILGLSSGAYFYNASVETLDGTALASITRFPSQGINSTHTISAERFTRLNGTVVRFRMVVWSE